MIRYVIPARRDSKGWPFKNRKLFNFTAMTIPEWRKDEVYVTSNDQEILKMAHDRGYHNCARPEHLAEDDTSMRDVLIDVSNTLKWDKKDWIIMLYLTYPERTWQDIEDALNFFSSNIEKSLLCRKEWQGVHPALCMFKRLDENKGTQLFKHDYYRRQEYPLVFEISHYIFICRVDELPKLNKNLYNDDTAFFPIKPRTIDVDFESDYKDFLNKTKQLEV